MDFSLIAKVIAASGRPFLLALAILASITIVLAIGAATAREAKAEPTQLAAINECVRLSSGQGREELVNTCRTCREVKIRRTRTANDFPALRSYRVPERSSVDLSFKGPGRTTIAADEACPGTETQANGQCVQMVLPTGRPAVLVNNCEACRSVKVETPTIGGGPARQSYMIQGKTYISAPWLKASDARIVSDGPCT